MTIAQIIAAKKAAANKGSSVAPAAIAERSEGKDAIDRIDPPGKSQRASAARKAAGIILSKELPPADVAEKAHYASQRLEVPQELIQPADDLPMCVWFDKGTVWLCMPCAVATMPPIKVMRLPWTVWPAPAPQPLPADEPF
jgi:hypothetical protein